jgi:hypothetical protein
MNNWKAVRTLLLVGEGETEVAFLNHVKSLYAPRGCGLRVFVKNAHGKGAKHVIEWTARQRGIAGYDTVAALFDTDQDWSDAVAKKAKAAKIRMLKSEPLFEAMMLRLLGQSDAGDSKTLKARFAPFANNDPLRAENYAANFGRECLDSKQATEPTIAALLALFK